MASKKILILVLSYNDSLYNKFYLTQKQTWDSIRHSQIKTLYYFGKKNFLSRPFFKPKIINNEIYLPMVDSYKGIRKKTVLAFKEILKFDFDYVFRTNSCSYIVKKKLYNFLENMPTDNFYCGVKGTHKGIDFISGAGYILSKDLVRKIVKSKYKFNDNFIDDVSLSIMLNNENINFDYSGKRIDIETFDNNISLDQYHYRFNTGGNRDLDIINMKRLHELIISQNESNEKKF